MVTDVRCGGCDCRCDCLCSSGRKTSVTCVRGNVSTRACVGMYACLQARDKERVRKIVRERKSDRDWKKEDERESKRERERE